MSSGDELRSRRRFLRALAQGTGLFALGGLAGKLLADRGEKYLCGYAMRDGVPCHFMYDPRTGLPEQGIPAGTSVSELPPTYVCPRCGSGRRSLVPASSVTVWQIDPRYCEQCGRCATACVLTPSAVKCVHDMRHPCGYCRICYGYVRPGYIENDEAAENQLCPTGAIQRRFIEEPFYEYTIDESKCIACGKCVNGCKLYGNGSLYLQIRRDLCLNCNDCAIARVCEGNRKHGGKTIRRIPADLQYIRKGSSG